MTIKTTRAAVAVIAASALVLSACGKEEETAAVSTTSSATSTSEATTTEEETSEEETSEEETTTEEETSEEESTTEEETSEEDSPEAETTDADEPAEVDGSEGVFPVTVTNCGSEVTVKQQPSHVVTLNQGATELALALGAADQMVGTAYLDDEIDPSVKAAYNKVPVLSDEYPSQEKFLSVKPDLALASYNSAFGDKGVGSREELGKLGIETYVDSFACKDKSKRAPVGWKSIYSEVTSVGKLLGRDSNARAIVSDTRTRLHKIREAKPAEGMTMFWYDSGGRDDSSKNPLVGGNAGGPALIMKAVGAKNIFDKVDGGWGDGSWEKVLEANPDYIVVADASWDTAKEKMQYLKSNSSTKDLDAVKNDRIIVVPFAESSPGVHLIDGAQKVAAGIKK